ALGCAGRVEHTGVDGAGAAAGSNNRANGGGAAGGGAGFSGAGLAGAAQMVDGGIACPDYVTHTDLGGGTGDRHCPAVLVDSTNAKLLIVTWDGFGPALRRCNLDGSACTYTVLDYQSRALWEPAAAIDPINGKLLVVTDDPANSDRPALFRCNLDG